jgi:hypothetical protein
MGADAETTQGQMTHCLSLLKYIGADAETAQGQLTHCLSLLKYMSVDGVGPTFAFSTMTVLLGMDSYKF